MSYMRQYYDLTAMSLLSYRQGIVFVIMVQTAMTVGLVLGYGYLMPDMSETAAIYLTTGAATNALVIVGLVVLPQVLSEAKHQGRMDFMLTLPISRELYLLSQATVAAILGLPGAVVAVLFGAWKYDVELSVSPWLPLVALLAVLSLAGVGVAVVALSNRMQVTNAITQLVIFYAIFFAPILLPKEQLPEVLQAISAFMPITYAADAMRGALTNLEGTNVPQDVLILTGFMLASLGMSAASIRKRG